MPKTVKGKYISMTEEEYNSIKKNGNEYRLTICFARDDVNKETEENIFKALASTVAKNAILKEFNISDHTFGQICAKRFGTSKIVEIREILREERSNERIRLALEEKSKESAGAVIPL